MDDMQIVLIPVAFLSQN